MLFLKTSPFFLQYETYDLTIFAKWEENFEAPEGLYKF